MTKYIWILTILFGLINSNVLRCQSTLGFDREIENADFSADRDFTMFSKSHHEQKNKISAQGGTINLANRVPKGYQLDFNYSISRELIFERKKGNKSVSAHVGFRYNRMAYRPYFEKFNSYLVVRSEENPPSEYFEKNYNNISETRVGLPVYVRYNNKSSLISFMCEAGTLFGSVKSTSSNENQDNKSWDFKGELLFTLGIAINLSDQFMLAPVYDAMNGFVIKAETRL